jgi:hypothetical protein
MHRYPKRTSMELKKGALKGVRRRQGKMVKPMTREGRVEDDTLHEDNRNSYTAQVLLRLSIDQDGSNSYCLCQK